MAMSLGPRGDRPLAEINVTPMADVMIVLLIIFMVATPFFDRPDVALPRAAQGTEGGERPVVLTLRADGKVLVGKDQASAGPALRLALAERLRGRPSEERSVVVVADERLAYAAIGDALRACREAGADEVELAVRSDR